MTVLRLWTMAALLLAGAAFGQGLEGTWTGTLEGAPFTLVLKPGGKAAFLGQVGRWESSAGAVVVTGADAETYRGALQGSSLVFSLEDGPLTLSRQVAQKKAAPFKPVKVLPGKRVKPEGTQLSLVVPAGFNSGWAQVDGAEAFAITPAGGAESPVVYATARHLNSTEAQLDTQGLFARWAPQLAQGTAVSSEAFSVGGRAGGQVVVDTAHQGKPSRVHFAVVAVDGWAIVFLGLATPAQAVQLAAVFGTVVGGLQGSMPKQPAVATGGGAGRGGGGAKGLARCWQEFVRASGGGSSSTRVQIAPDGSYHWRSHTGMPGYSSVHAEPGTWSANANTITLVPQDGCPTVTYSYGFSGSSLIMAGVRYISCD